jgi:hypothetical protein
MLLNLAMKYNFIEKKLGPDFAREKIKEIKTLINHSISFSLSGMPGVGGSIFLRYLSLQVFANFIYIDTYSLSEINRLGYYKLLLKELGNNKDLESEQECLELCRSQLQLLTKTNKRVVLILNRFDQLKPIFSNQFFADLLSFINVDREKIVLIITANKPYFEILPTGISADKVNIFSKAVYLPPFEALDYPKLLTISGFSKLHSREFNIKALELASGHYQLLQLLLKSERLELPFIDQFIKYQLQEIYNYLSFEQKKQIKKVAQDKIVGEVDSYLLDVGIIKKNTSSYRLFSPLFQEFVIGTTSNKFSVKEAKLFKLFKDNLNKVVTTDDIFKIVWGGEENSATDWGLSSLLYRLRKHPLVSGQGYFIESYKKLGYRMVKE